MNSQNHQKIFSSVLELLSLSIQSIFFSLPLYSCLPPFNTHSLSLSFLNSSITMASNQNQSNSTKKSSRKSRAPTHYQASSTQDYYLTEEPQSGYSYQQPVAGGAYDTYSSGGYYEHGAWKWTCVGDSEVDQFEGFVAN